MTESPPTEGAARVRTVRGDIDPASVGRVLFHEHLLFDLVLPSRRAAIDDPPVTLANRWQIDYRSNENRNNARQLDPAVTAAELTALKADGGSLIVDQSTFGLARDPVGLAAASAEAGVHVVAAAGFYCEAYLDDAMTALTTAEIATRFIAEIEQGLDGTDIRAGLIGEIGCSWPLAPVERRALEAAAVAARATGAAISVHPGRHRDAPFQIAEILRAAGADLARVVICHMDRTYPDGDGIAELLTTGVCVEWDFFGIEQSHYWFGEVELPTDLQRLRLIEALMRQGFADRILVSQDICSCTRMLRWGGHGYGHLLRNGPALMRRAGLGEAAIDQLLRTNPLRLLTLAPAATT